MFSTIGSIFHTVAVSTGATIAFEMVSLLTTEQERTATAFAKFRQALFDIQSSCKNWMGERSFTWTAEVIRENMWITCIAIISILKMLNLCSLAADIFVGSVAFLPVAALFWTAKKVHGAYKLYQQEPRYLDLCDQIYNERAFEREPLNLSTATKIPRLLFTDPTFDRYRCKITKQPIRFAMKEPGSNAVYDHDAIVNYIGKHGCSPETEKPLSYLELETNKEIQDRINAQLEEYTQKLRLISWCYLIPTF